jgi:hypothetical protein
MAGHRHGATSLFVTAEPCRRRRWIGTETDGLDHSRPFGAREWITRSFSVPIYPR